MFSLLCFVYIYDFHLTFFLGFWKFSAKKPFPESFSVVLCFRIAARNASVSQNRRLEIYLEGISSFVDNAIWNPYYFRLIQTFKWLFSSLFLVYCVSNRQGTCRLRCSVFKKSSVVFFFSLRFWWNKAQALVLCRIILTIKTRTCFRCG